MSAAHPLPPDRQGGFKIFVNTMTLQSIVINVESSFTVRMLKEVLAQRTNTDVDNFDLMFTGEELIDDNKTLADYNVEAEVIIHMITKVHGGL